MVAVDLGNKEQKQCADGGREDKRNDGAFFGFLWREVVCDLVKKSVVVADACVSCLGRTFVEIDLENAELFFQSVNGSWVFNM